MNLAVYRRIQMFSLRVFRVRLTFGKMLFRSGTHCWCWEKTHRQLPLDFISWWFQGSVHSGATTCHIKKNKIKPKSAYYTKHNVTLQYVHVYANTTLSAYSYRGVVWDTGLIIQSLVNHSSEGCFQWFMKHLYRVVLREPRFSFFNSALGSNIHYTW